MMLVRDMPQELQVRWHACMDEAQAEVDAAIDAMTDAEWLALMAGDDGERGIKRMLVDAMARRGWTFDGPLGPREDA